MTTDTGERGFERPIWQGAGVSAVGLQNTVRPKRRCGEIVEVPIRAD